MIDYMMRTILGRRVYDCACVCVCMWGGVGGGWGGGGGACVRVFTCMHTCALFWKPSHSCASYAIVHENPVPGLEDYTLLVRLY